MQCAFAMLPSVASTAIQYFPTSSHKGHGFRGKKMLLNIKCVFWFSLQILYETFFIPRKTDRDMIKNVYWSSYINIQRCVSQTRTKLNYVCYCIRATCFDWWTVALNGGLWLIKICKNCDRGAFQLGPQPIWHSVWLLRQAIHSSTIFPSLYL